MTPHERHSGQEAAIIAQREAVYEQAKARHPERWQGAIRNWKPVTEVWLNPNTVQWHMTMVSSKVLVG